MYRVKVFSGGPKYVWSVLTRRNAIGHLGIEIKNFITEDIYDFDLSSERTHIYICCYPAPQLTRVGNGTDPPPRQAN
jgi:hypothetical protein